MGPSSNKAGPKLFRHAREAEIAEPADKPVAASSKKVINKVNK